MLKITKGLKPFVKDGITPYTDVQGNRYVRVKVDGEDFCIATQDYTEDGKYYFTWDDAMDALKAEGLTTFTKDQALICNNNINEINEMFEEIGGNKLKKAWYWTSSEYNSNKAWCFENNYGQSRCDDKNSTHLVRPVLNL